jgi:hypothetical protein
LKTSRMQYFFPCGFSCSNSVRVLGFHLQFSVILDRWRTAKKPTIMGFFTVQQEKTNTSSTALQNEQHHSHLRPRIAPLAERGREHVACEVNARQFTLLSYPSTPPRMGGETRMTPSPRTNSIGMFRFFACRQQSEKAETEKDGEGKGRGEGGGGG